METISETDFTGRRFDRLVAIRRLPREENVRHIYWLCRCDCGNEKPARIYALLEGKVRSCGCRNRENLAQGLTRSHGRTYTPEYAIWLLMRRRCLRPINDKERRNYAGRGILINPRWSSFETFLADMGPRPSPKHTLERVDNDGPYSPENCRWATRAEQALNRQTNRLISAFGETKPLCVWARERNLTPHVISYRIKNGWDTEKALTAPMKRYAPRTKRAKAP